VTRSDLWYRPDYGIPAGGDTIRNAANGINAIASSTAKRITSKMIVSRFGRFSIQVSLSDVSEVAPPVWRDSWREE
jgi:hypothetical protein